MEKVMELKLEQTKVQQVVRDESQYSVRAGSMSLRQVAEMQRLYKMRQTNKSAADLVGSERTGTSVAR